MKTCQPPTLRFGNFLAPNMLPVYTAIAERISHRLGLSITMQTGTCYEHVPHDFDVCFLCGLAYIELVDQKDMAIEPLAAPVLQGERFGGKPIYYSDVVVHRRSNFQVFNDLRGRRWSYNEPYSQSGYGITRYCLAQLGEPLSFFGEVIQAGWHERSIQMVCTGAVDASTIDCHVLSMAIRAQPELRSQLRIIASLGPSTIQPVTVSSALPVSLKDELRHLFLELHREPAVQPYLRHGLIDRFVGINDAGYDDLRNMRQAYG